MKFQKIRQGLKYLKTKKLFTIAFFVLLILAVLAACSSTGDNDAEPPYTANDETPTNGRATPNGATPDGEAIQNGADPAETDPPLGESPSDIVLSFMRSFSAGEIADAYALSDATMQNVDLQRLLEIFNFSRGEITDFSINSYYSQGDFLFFYVDTTHTLGTTMYRIPLNADMEVAGFTTAQALIPFYVPAAGSPTYSGETVIIGEGTEWALSGLLTLPAGASAENPVPAVLLVHGSGPADMDMSIFGHRPFFDVADYLSENGIAVLRYAKRSLLHFQTYESLTVWEETVEDAVLAAEILRADPRISEVYMLGWSLGASLAPRIHASGGNFDGLILFAGSPRSLADIAYDQHIAELTRLLDLLGELPELTAMLEELEAFAELAASVPDMTADEAKATFLLPINVYAYYLKDMMAAPFEYFVANVTVPMLVMQGRNDFQVLAEVDFALLRDLLDGRENVTFILYDYLDHFFMPSIARNFNEHREIFMLRPVGTRVDENALRDVAEWVLAR